MKPIYKLTTMSWYVEGLGFFKTKEEALVAIDDTKLKHSILIRVSNKTKRYLQRLANDKHITMSEVVRQLIEKEIK